MKILGIEIQFSSFCAISHNLHHLGSLFLLPIQGEGAKTPRSVLFSIFTEEFEKYQVANKLVKGDLY